MNHLDSEVQKAIIRLNDALCIWERGTSRKSVLIIREQGGFVHRSISGKPGVSVLITDNELIDFFIDK